MRSATARGFPTWVHRRSLRSPGRLARLLEAPGRRPAAALWTTWETVLPLAASPTQDSREPILPWTLVPFEAHEGIERPEESRRQTVEVNIGSGAITPIDSRCKAALNWTGSILAIKSKIFSYDGELRHSQTRKGRWPSAMSTMCPAPREIHFRETAGGRWRATSGEEAPPLDVFLREGLNSPPELYYRKKGSPHAHVLLNLNPQFRRIALARERLVTWDWSKGHSITAGLYYPPH